MQVSVEATGALERRMEVSVPRERVEQAIDERLRHVSRTARLKGFRPGKAPLSVIRRQFGAQVRQEVLSELMRESFTEAVTQEKLSPAAGPRIEPLSLDSGEDLRYRAVFEVFPEIPLANVDGLAVTKPQADVTEADVDAMVQNLREQRPDFVEVERPSQLGDRVTMDFEGRIDGEPFEGSKGDGVALVLGGGRMLADFEAGITGMSAGEQRTVKVRYPDDYHNKALAGREPVFDVRVGAVEERRLPELDEAFCLAYGVSEGGLEQLRSEVADNMRRELATSIRNRIKEQLLESLLQANPVAPPQVLVDSQVREMQLDAARRMGAKDASQLPPAETFAELARRRVALGLLIGELIKTRGLQVDRARVEERLAEFVASHTDPESLAKAYRENRDAMRQIENLVLEEQVVDYLLERAKVTERPATFRELMNFGA